MSDPWMDDKKKNSVFGQKRADVRSRTSDHPEAIQLLQEQQKANLKQQQMSNTQLRLAALPPEYQAAQQKAAEQLAQRGPQPGFQPGYFSQGNSGQQSQPQYSQQTSQPNYSQQQSQPDYSQQSGHPVPQPGFGAPPQGYAPPSQGFAPANGYPGSPQQSSGQQPNLQPQLDQSAIHQTGQHAPVPPAAPTRTKHELSEEEIDERALFDSQTRAFNLRHTVRLLRQELTRATYFKKNVSLLVVSIDGYDQILMDHSANAVEKAVDAISRALLQFCRPVDLVGRYTDSRFMVVCPEMDDKQASALAEKIRKISEEIIIAHQWQNFSLSTSIGIASLSPECDDVESFIALADLGADMVTENGGNGVFFPAGAQ